MLRQPFVFLLTEGFLLLSLLPALIFRQCKQWIALFAVLAPGTITITKAYNAPEEKDTRLFIRSLLRTLE